MTASPSQLPVLDLSRFRSDTAERAEFLRDVRNAAFGPGFFYLVGHGISDRTATFALVPRSPAKRTTSAAVLDFFRWAYAHGDGIARSLQFVPLPGKVKADIVKHLMI
jgi:hypothetical protein